MFDLVTLAFQADLTRVVTFMYSREGGNRTYRSIGVADAHRRVSHQVASPERSGVNGPAPENRPGPCPDARLYVVTNDSGDRRDVRRCSACATPADGCAGLCSTTPLALSDLIRIAAAIIFTALVSEPTHRTGRRFVLRGAGD